MKYNHIIEFDGGSTCNVPKLGYGDGYGSYQIDQREIVRLQFGKGFSANAAEILTLAASPSRAAAISDPSKLNVLVRGDSKIALKWSKANPARCQIPGPATSKGFRDAIIRLHKTTIRFHSLHAEWRGREESVRIFGH